MHKLPYTIRTIGVIYSIEYSLLIHISSSYPLAYHPKLFVCICVCLLSFKMSTNTNTEKDYIHEMALFSKAYNEETKHQVHNILTMDNKAFLESNQHDKKNTQHILKLGV